MLWSVLARVLVILGLVWSASVSAPLGGSLAGSLLVGVLAGALVVVAELYLRNASGLRLLGAVLGGAVGVLMWQGVDRMFSWADHGNRWVVFLHTLIPIALVYLGVMIGAQKGDWLAPSKIIGLFRTTAAERRYKVLDTSVIIDGRIADICEVGFLDGALLVPQFVLKELQLVADSSDTLKRNRGRRGLDILQKIQKMSGVEVIISDIDFPEVREVDLKLIELARHVQGKIVTNDFNLNKVASLRGVAVLNINELANALKPVVLPGEFMRVFILKEGKEYNQGVAYLDDGTMVVVDNARKLIGKTIDVVVTSVLQTTAGKMIFGRHIEAANQAVQVAAQAPPASPERDDAARRSRPVNQA